MSTPDRIVMALRVLIYFLIVLGWVLGCFLAGLWCIAAVMAGSPAAGALGGFVLAFLWHCKPRDFDVMDLIRLLVYKEKVVQRIKIGERILGEKL